MIRLLAALAVMAALVGCATPGERGSETRTQTEVSYAEIASSHNARAARLARLWARAAVQIRYTDGDGRTRREQGEGHLQVLQPGRMALSVGKLGEVIFWLGCDGERFWWFELGDDSVAAVARHENAMRPCVGELPLPVHPLDLLDLLGVTAIPEQSAGGVVVGPRGRLVVDVPARGGARRVFFDRDTLRPVRVELWLPGRDEPAVEADLSEYERVDVPSEAGVDPRAASRVSVRVRETGAELVLFLSDFNDGSRAGRLAPAVFDFETLVGAHRPSRVVVLDADCPTPAAVP